MTNKKYYLFENTKNTKLFTLYSKRPMDFNSPTNTKENITNQYIEIQKDFNIKFNRIIESIEQTHSTNIAIVTKDNYQEDFTNVDGFITKEKNIALCIRTADCQSIVLYDKENEVIANIHSGWKGTVNKILLNAINLMKSEFNCNPSNIEAYFYPSILQCCFEVEIEVVNQFKDSFPNIDEYTKQGDIIEGKQKYYIDTIKLNIDLLKSLGLKEENIYNSKECTKCLHETYHSFRYDKSASGRNITIACLKD